MIKVLIVDNSSYVTGAAKSISRFARALSNEFEFQWAVTEKLSEEDLKAVVESDKFYRFRFVEISRDPGRLVTYVPRLIINTAKLNRIVKENDIGIVHVNDLYNMVGVAVRVLNRKVKIIYHVRLLRKSHIGPLYGFFLSMIERVADAIVCCSNAVSKDVGDRKIPKSVIYDSEEFGNREAAPPKLNAELRNILYIGNILPGKGHDLAIETVRLLRQGGLEVNLRIIGKVDDSAISRNYKDALDRMIADAGLESSVEFAGFQRDVAAEIRKADLVLNLSESESFSMVCLEALKTGVPLVASDCGGPGEIIEHMKSGWLVPNKDYKAAAVAINKLASNYEQRQRFSADGRANVRHRFNVANNAKDLSRVYHGSLNPKSECEASI